MEKSTTWAHRAQAYPAYLLIFVGAASGCTSLAINGHHGWMTGGALALIIYSLADVARISVLLTTKKWSRYLITVVALCAATSIYCATETLLTGQGQSLLNAATDGARHDGATTDLAAARKTLSGISEKADASTLSDMASAAKGRAETAEKSDTARMGGTPSCFKECKAAKLAHEAILARLADAKARDTATAALAVAKADEVKVKPAEVSGVATFFAMNGLGSKDANARYAALGQSILVIALLESLVYLIVVGGDMLRQPAVAAVAISDPVEEKVEAPKVAMNKKSQTLLRLQLLAYNSPGHQYVSSQRKLADELNVKRSTFSEWLSQWQASGLIEVSSFGRKTKFSAPRKRVA
jgi:hypothetical protein